jgi:hypothetical protein
MIDVILLTGALLAAQAPSVEPAPPAAASTDERRICRTIRQVGSRLGSRRICGTQAEWDNADSEARRTMAEGQQRMLSPTYDDLQRNANGIGSNMQNRPTTRCARC